MDSRPRATRRPLSFSVLTALLFAASAAFAAEEPVTRTFRLQHVPVANVQAALRGVIEVRRIAMDETRGTITVSDSQATIDRVEAFLRDMDVPPPIWTAELRITQGGQERALRTLRVQDGESVDLTFGSTVATKAMLSFRLKARRVASTELEADYSVVCHGGTDSRTPLEFGEEGREVLHAGDEIRLAAPELRGQREELARLLGVEQPVERLVVRAAPD